jgi:hypothetical protein
MIHCVSYDRAALDGGPEDLEEQLRNDIKAPFRDMSREALSVFESVWDPALDGCLWPPRGDMVVKGFPR